MLAGTRLSFDEESQALYDAVAPTHTEAEFASVLAALEAKLPGRGPLVDRYDEFRKQFVIAPDRLDAVFKAAIDGLPQPDAAAIQLPPGESFTVEYVTGKSWSGYNWYQGNYRSLIQVNTDLPIYIDRAIDLACHEGYPGHHVYNVLLEKNLVRDRGWVEFSVYPLFSPQSLIAEGTANFGIEVAFPRTERLEFERRVLFPAAQLKSEMAAAVLRRAGAGGPPVVRRQRGGAPVSERTDRRARGRGLARTLWPVFTPSRRAARPLHRPVPQLRHQLQPGQGHGGRARRGARRHPGQSGEAVG